ncbi:MAG: MBL fold metallo-hydrolase [Nitrospirae bacterium]|nr:MAG: MBL fold metallo-hydrolase [Nitrospirota bacterium]
MSESLKIGRFELHWLRGGEFELDGGAMFGVVPKVLWEKKYPTSTGNNIKLVAYPILVKTPHGNLLIETGLGNKLTEKQRKIFSQQSEWMVLEDLQALGLSPDDIDYVVLTHCDFDHSGGIVSSDGDDLTLTFPRARHLIQKKEWEDVKNPGKRASHTFWSINFTGLEESGNLELVEGVAEVLPGVTLIHTGGHNRGHQIVRMESDGEVVLHLGDLLPTHIHFNPLWVMAYDNYPLEVISLKERYEKEGIEENAWFTFYHDPFLRACRFDEKGNTVDVLR